MKAFLSTIFQGVNRVLEIFGLRLLRTNMPARSFGLFFKHLKSLAKYVPRVVTVFARGDQERIVKRKRCRIDLVLQKDQVLQL